MVKRSGDDTERRIHVLPKELLERVRAYQADNGISSEVEAVRRLLDMALQMRDTLDDVLRKLKLKLSEERDLRTLARDILWSHPKITGVQFGDGDLTFDFSDGSSGKIDQNGRLSVRYSGDNYDNWHDYTLISEREKQPKSTVGRRDIQPSIFPSDDEIPF